MNSLPDPMPQDGPREACGLFGVFGHPDAAMLTYYGLYALQHRGQESAGIVVSDGEEVSGFRGMGLVAQVFTPRVLSELKGSMAIGHTRYSTTGSSHLRNAQPLLVDSSQGQMAVAHNGNLVNANILRDELEAEGSIFQTTTDSEIILHLMAKPPSDDGQSRLICALRRIRGAYSLLLLTPEEIIAVRDPDGFRPLCIGQLDDAWIVASETCALDLVNASLVREVDPGEIVVINRDGVRSIRPFAGAERSHFCIFEYVYFARPDSRINGRNVHQVRVELGRLLAREHRVDADIVMSVPDSGNSAALGYSLESGIPLEMGFVRNHYIGRTFLHPTQLIRNFQVRVKLNLIPDVVRGKRVVVVDDSIVRGTTSRARVTDLRSAGAREVHMRVSCPPHRFPCHYGVDFPTTDELLASSHNEEQIRRFLGVESVGYLSLPSMIEATGLTADQFCVACYSGRYPVPFDEALHKHVMERRRARRDRLGEEAYESVRDRLF